MKKITALTVLAFSMFFLAACDSMDNPSPLDTRASGMSNELNPGDLPSDASMNADGLQDRGINDMGGFDPENIKPEDIVETVYFGFNEYAVATSEREKVKKAVDYYTANADYKVVLVGHTDWYGTEEYNTLLSGKRCDSVKEYATSLGLNEARVEVVARGELGSTLDVDKNSPQAQKDRRVDIVKFKK